MSTVGKYRKVNHIFINWATNKLKMKYKYIICNTIKNKIIKKNLSRDMQSLYPKTHKTLLKDMFYVCKWRELTCAWVRRLNIIKIFIILKSFYIFIVILKGYFWQGENWQVDSKKYMEIQRI